MRSLKQEIFTIPNILSFFRLILIPVFAVSYLNAKDTADYYAAAGILLISSLTDFFDGKIARKYNLITKLGKALDPIADKATHGVVMLCLCTRYPIMWILIALFVLKEGFMGIMGIFFLHKGKMLRGAMWFGKVCTALLFVVLLVLVIFPSLTMGFVNALCLLCALVMALTLILYIPVFANMKNHCESTF